MLTIARLSRPLSLAIYPFLPTLGLLRTIRLIVRELAVPQLATVRLEQALRRIGSETHKRLLFQNDLYFA